MKTVKLYEAFGKLKRRRLYLRNKGKPWILYSNEWDRNQPSFPNSVQMAGHWLVIGHHRNFPLFIINRAPNQHVIGQELHFTHCDAVFRLFAMSARFNKFSKVAIWRHRFVYCSLYSRCTVSALLLLASRPAPGMFLFLPSSLPLFSCLVFFIILS